MPQPLFQQVLGDAAWRRLALAVRRHYDLSPERAATLTLHGTMKEVWHAPWVKPWLWLARCFDALVPYTGRDVPVQVVNRTDPARPDALFFHRTFRFSGDRTVVFQSRMVACEPGEVVELLRFGVGIRMAVAEQNGALVFHGIEYGWLVGGVWLGIPNRWLLGDALIVEKALSEDELRLDFDIVHPWLGRSFAYRGQFRP